MIVRVFLRLNPVEDQEINDAFNITLSFCEQQIEYEAVLLFFSKKVNKHLRSQFQRDIKSLENRQLQIIERLEYTITYETIYHTRFDYHQQQIEMGERDDRAGTVWGNS